MKYTFNLKKKQNGDFFIEISFLHINQLMGMHLLVDLKFTPKFPTFKTRTESGLWENHSDVPMHLVELDKCSICEKYTLKTSGKWI